MKRTLLALTLLIAVAAHAEPRLERITPETGLPFVGGIVTLHGTDLVEAAIDCTGECTGPLPGCPVQVRFGTVPGTVHEATKTSIRVYAPPQPEGTVVDVILRVDGRPDLVLPRAFRSTAEATLAPEDYRKYLLPVSTRELRGANGSVWKTDWTLHNTSEERFLLRVNSCMPFANPCFAPIVEPGTTHSMNAAYLGDGFDGAFVYVPRAVSVPMELRVRDISRGDQSWGTELPIVQEKEFRLWKHILDVPTDPRYRATLRIYSAGEAPTRVRVSVHSMTTGAQLDSREVDLGGVNTLVYEPLPYHPAYAQLDPLTPAVRAGAERVRIKVEVVGHELISPPPPGIWAFVTVTNDTTQQVTAITP